MYDNYTNGAMDEAMVDVVSEEMRKKLRLKRRDGRSGWFKPEVSSEKLWRMLEEHVRKRDTLDVLNLAATILARKYLYGDRA